MASIEDAPVLAELCVQLVSKESEIAVRRASLRTIHYDRARADVRESDGRLLVTVPYRDHDPTLVDAEGMYVAVFDRLDGVSSARHYGDSSYLVPEEYARYLSGELPGGLEEGDHHG